MRINWKWLPLESILIKNLLGDWSIKNAKIANFVYHEIGSRDCRPQINQLVLGVKQKYQFPK